MNRQGADQLPATSQAVAAALRQAGSEPDIRELPDSTRTAAEAAQALGCPVAAIANSLIFHCGPKPLLVMVSGGNRGDTSVLATRLESEPITRATPNQVRAATGQAIGGVAPLGHPEPIATVIDETLAEHDEIWVAAGTPHTVFSTTYGALVAMTGGREMRVAS